MAAHFTFHQSEREMLVRQANTWLSDFSLSLSPPPGCSATDLGKLAKKCEDLAMGGSGLLSELRRVAEPEDEPLLLMLQQSIDQVPGVELDLRKRLARVSTTGEGGWVDFNDLRVKLAELAARREIGASSVAEIPSVLELSLGKRNVLAGLSVGVFALAWNSFTLFHAIAMIGRLSKVVGFFTIFLAGFYALFFGVGAGLIFATFEFFCDKELILEGNLCTVRRRLGRFVHDWKKTLHPETRAELMVTSRTEDTTRRQIVLKDEKGNPFNLPEIPLVSDATKVVDQINSYLAAHQASLQ
ncbi:MAG: hypothetical protein MUC92_08650 [Fimbriimonadaceae bacterium]|nr:hypothetical protein [Fimbriimonadaceae bacterium]